MFQRGLQNWFISASIALIFMLYVFMVRIVKIEQRLKKVFVQSEQEGSSVPPLFPSEKGALVCQLSWILGGIIIMIVNICTSCNDFNGLNYRITYLLYTLGQCTNYMFMYFRFRSFSSRVNSKVHPLWSQIFFCGILCIPIVAFISFFCFISAQEDSEGKCIPNLPGWLAVTFIVSDTLLSSIGFYLFLKPLYLLKRAHHYSRQTSLQEAEKKLIMSNFYSVALSVSSTFVFMFLITFYTSRNVDVLIDLVWPLGPVDAALNSLSVGIAFGDFSFSIWSAPSQTGSDSPTVSNGSSNRRPLIVDSLKDSAFDSLHALEVAFKSQPKESPRKTNRKIKKIKISPLS